MYVDERERERTIEGKDRADVRGRGWMDGLKRGAGRWGGNTGGSKRLCNASLQANLGSSFLVRKIRGAHCPVNNDACTVRGSYMREKEGERNQNIHS